MESPKIIFHIYGQLIFDRMPMTFNGEGTIFPIRCGRQPEVYTETSMKLEAFFYYL
jgi:hypothetical protein